MANTNQQDYLSYKLINWCWVH